MINGFSLTMLRILKYFNIAKNVLIIVEAGSLDPEEGALYFTSLYV